MNEEHSGIYTYKILEKMLLYNKIDLSDIPFEVRSLEKNLYVTACRLAREHGIQKLRKVLTLIKKDMVKMDQWKQITIQNIIDGYEILLE